MAFQDNSAFIAAARNPGTADRATLEAIYQLELALSILRVLLNVTYEWSFSRLWQIRYVVKPELGFSDQRSFSIIVDGQPASLPELGFSMRFREQWFDIHEDVVANWHSMGLGVLNRLVADPAYPEADVVERLSAALRHFQLAATQHALEMQMSTLWVRVESLFTGASDRVLNANLPGLVATTVSSLRREYWPSRSSTPDELRQVFTKYYDHRSRTLHHGRRGHASESDVQEFSLVVASLIIDVAYMIQDGARTASDLARASRRAIGGLDPNAASTPPDD